MSKKTAVVYDKWLRSMGGGEVVACNIAKILHNEGYEVTFICGKMVDKDTIENKLGIDLSGISFVEIWSDERKIRRVARGQDIFVNTSFTDYTYGYAKKNIYYTHFPKRPYRDVGEKFFNGLLIPLITKIIKPLELMSDADITATTDNNPAYLLHNDNRIAIYYLQPHKPQVVDFTLFLSSFYQSLVKSIKFHTEEARIVDQRITVNHHKNQISFQLTIIPMSSTVYLTISKDNGLATREENQVYLLYPKVEAFRLYEPLYKLFYHRLNNRLRAGIFAHPLERLKSYQIILANSAFTQKWVKNYWKRDSVIVYPPVEMIFRKYDLSKVNKKNWICSVGRFFKLGHGKKQEILVKAFKNFYDLGHKDWQLHLVGGLDSDESSIQIVESLKRESASYPIFFHLNAMRKEVEEVYLNSKIYWHATGFGESERRYPILFEHFGIAPIEAISAGCIPVLFDGGGLKEIINEIGLPQDLHLFKSIKQLVENTITVSRLNTQDINWQLIFEKFENNFSQEAFKKRFLEVIK